MNESLFGILLVVLGVTYGFRNKITTLLNKLIFTQDDEFKLERQHLTYFLMFLFAIVLALGMTMGKDVQRKTYGNISDGFEKVRNPDDKPNPLFDINTYW